MTWTQFELLALLSKCCCPGGRLPASPRLCSGTHGRGEQSRCGYSELIISSIFVNLTFTYSASSYWGSRCTSFIWQGCCLNGKNLNNTKQKILYCIITSAYKMFKVTRLFHPSKCTKWRIKSLCFFLWNSWRNIINRKFLCNTVANIKILSFHIRLWPQVQLDERLPWCQARVAVNLATVDKLSSKHWSKTEHINIKGAFICLGIKN